MTAVRSRPIEDDQEFDVRTPIKLQREAGRYTIFVRSKRRVVLSGSETEEQAKAAESMQVALPRLPSFKSIHEQRLDMKRKLVAGFRIFAKYGWDEGTAGHMTFRDPEYPDLYWVNPLGKYFGHLKTSDLLLVDMHGNIVRGNRTASKAVLMIHGTIQRMRSDVVCTVHAHSIYGRTFSALGRPLLPITQDACAFYGSHSVYPEFGGVVFMPEEGEKLARALGPTNKAVILQNHGLLTTGATVDDAIWWFICMERCCQSQLVAEAACVNGYKDLKLIPDEVARGVHDNIGDHQAGYAKFQPLYDMIVREQPDILDDGP